MRTLKTGPSNPAIRTPAGAFLLLLSLSVQALAQSPTADSFNPGVATHDPNASPYVDSVAVQADGKILVGGIFDTLGSQGRTNIGRVNRDGSLDLGFTAAAGGYEFAEVYCLAVQPDGKILVGGDFATLNGQNRTNIGRLNADGTLDASFYPGAGSVGPVNCIALQPDGSIVVGGSFTYLNGEYHYRIGRLNADGTVDQGFQPWVTAIFIGFPSVTSLALQPDGKILVGGSFAGLAGQAAQNLGRLNADGTPDWGVLQSGPASFANRVTIQSDERFLASDQWGSIQRWDANGAPDANFYAQSASGVLNPIAIQADGKILVGGNFTTMSGLDQTNLARLNTDGRPDPGFEAGTDYPQSARVLSLALQSDGKIITAGNFGRLAGQSRTNIGRLNATDAATQTLTFDGSTVTWMRGGTSPDVWRTTFEYLHGGSWTPLGAGVRVPGGWELDGLSLPTNATIRARGFIGAGGKGDSFVESVLNPALAIADAHLSGGKFSFNALGPAGQVVVIEASTNLITWARLQTNSLGVGPFAFSDSQTVSFPKRFYRLRPGP